MKLQLFFWFNSICGALPLSFQKENGTPKLSYSFIGCLCFPAMIWNSYSSVMSLCSVYSIEINAPQWCICVVVHILTSLCFIHRIFSLKETKYLFSCTTLNISENDKYFVHFFKMVVINLILSALAVFAAVGPFFLWRRKSIMFILLHLSGFYPGKAKQFCLASQLVYFCNYVEKSLHKINSSLTAGQLQDGKIRNMKAQIQENYKIFWESLDAYAIDMVVVIIILGIDFYVRFNDFYMLTTVTFSAPAPSSHIKSYCSSIIYFIAYILVSNIYMFWFSKEVTDLNKMVNRTRTILLHIDFSTLQEDAKDELILFLEQLDQTKLVVDAFGFFNVGRKLLFKGFCQVTTFVVLFIQLNKIRSAS